MGKRRSTGHQPTASFDTPPDMENYSGLDSDVGARLDLGGATTGRKIVTILSDDPEDKKKVVEYFAARDVKDLLQTADYEASAFSASDASASEAVVMDNLPIIVLNERPNVHTALTAQAVTNQDDEIRRLFVVEEELRYFPSCSTNPGLAGGSKEGLDDGGYNSGSYDDDGSDRVGLSPYSQGYLRGIYSVCRELLGEASGSIGMTSHSSLAATAFARCFQDSGSFTWGLQATQVSNSNLTGAGIRVAILDTGFDFSHSDSNFASRVMASATFVGGTAHDQNGHGTHVTGTACGPRSPGLGMRRYGCATEADILVGRVLGPNGGDDTSVLGGINWAIGQQCDIINMSLGPRACRLNPAFSASHERVAQIALRRGVLLIAAAGNNSNRPGMVCPVVGPAAAPSIVAVAAVDRCGLLARFSNQGQNANGGEINFAAPGVDVFSSWTSSARHLSISGTSMAAPHVAGIAALIAQQTSLRGLPLYRQMRSRALDIAHPRQDMGNGFVRV